MPAGSSVGQLWALVCELRRDNAALHGVVEAQNARIAALERQLGKDSSTSSRPGPPGRDPSRQVAAGRILGQRSSLAVAPSVAGPPV